MSIVYFVPFHLSCQKYRLFSIKTIFKAVSTPDIHLGWSRILSLPSSVLHSSLNTDTHRAAPPSQQLPSKLESRVSESLLKLWLDVNGSQNLTKTKKMVAHNFQLISLATSLYNMPKIALGVKPVFLWILSTKWNQCFMFSHMLTLYICLIDIFKLVIKLSFKHSFLPLNECTLRQYQWLCPNHQCS